jgi:hypothetical protein
MQIDVNKLLEVYQAEITRLMNENLVLKTQLLQLEEEVKKNEGNIQG